jgi:Mycotoxin biosynthesis protein UstYa
VSVSTKLVISNSKPHNHAGNPPYKFLCLKLHSTASSLHLGTFQLSFQTSSKSTTLYLLVLVPRPRRMDIYTFPSTPSRRPPFTVITLVFLAISNIFVLFLLCHVSAHQATPCRIPTSTSSSAPSGSSSSNAKSESNSLGSHPRTFFSDLLPAIVLGRRPENERKEDTLLDQAQSAKTGGFLMLSENGAKVKSYGVSMFHQLHCVDMLRDTVKELHEDEHGDGNATEMHAHYARRRLRWRAGLNVVEHQLQGNLDPTDHLDHCLDYISQVGGLSAKFIRFHPIASPSRSFPLLSTSLFTSTFHFFPFISSS